VIVKKIGESGPIKLIAKKRKGQEVDPIRDRQEPAKTKKPNSPTGRESHSLTGYSTPPGSNRICLTKGGNFFSPDPPSGPFVVQV